MPSIETYADRFVRLDHAIRNAPPEMPDEDFGQLVRDWGRARLKMRTHPSTQR